MRTIIVQPIADKPSETFLRAHRDHLPGVVRTVHRATGGVAIDGSLVLSESLMARARRKLHRMIRRRGWELEIDTGLRTAIRQQRPDVVLAEYGFMGVRVLDICRRRDIPLVVHFHGFDAYSSTVIDKFGEKYRELFEYAASVVAVSRAMRRTLEHIGCPPEKLVYSPYGVDCNRFCGALPEIAPPVFLAVGRMVEKKAPENTIRAFSLLQRVTANSKLRMIGDGPLLERCRECAKVLGLEESVHFLGAQPHDVVLGEMKRARAFVQHSVVAQDGDQEGTPVAILEASAAGLPVISTQHGGIPDAIVDGATGYLVDEGDVSGMASKMVRISREPKLAGALGGTGARHVRQFFSMESSISRLHRILQAAASRQDCATVFAEIERELPQSCPDRDSSRTDQLVATESL